MTETEFRHNMAGAQVFARLPKSPQDEPFWAGYQQGLRRFYHGVQFGTPEEHAARMALADNAMGDKTRRARGLGYRAGFAGVSVETAIAATEQI